ncbi:Sodium- and chloride-dependent neutral and basic amino acid transporter B(0+), partial [Ophiophagus hannah]
MEEMLAEDDGDWSPVHLEERCTLRDATSHLSFLFSTTGHPDLTKYPDWGTAVGWCMIIFCLIWIPVVAFYKVAKAKGNLWQVSIAGGREGRRRGWWQKDPKVPRRQAKPGNPTSSSSSSFQRLVSCCKPKPSWGPYLERHRGERYKDMADPVKKQDVEIPTVDRYIRHRSGIQTVPTSSSKNQHIPPPIGDFTAWKGTVRVDRWSKEGEGLCCRLRVPVTPSEIQAAEGMPFIGCQRLHHLPKSHTWGALLLRPARWWRAGWALSIKSQQKPLTPKPPTLLWQGGVPSLAGLTKNPLWRSHENLQSHQSVPAWDPLHTTLDGKPILIQGGFLLCVHGTRTVAQHSGAAHPNEPSGLGADFSRERERERESLGSGTACSRCRELAGQLIKEICSDLGFQRESLLSFPIIHSPRMPDAFAWAKGDPLFRENEQKKLKRLRVSSQEPLVLKIRHWVAGWSGGPVTGGQKELQWGGGGGWKHLKSSSLIQRGGHPSSCAIHPRGLSRSFTKSPFLDCAQSWVRKHGLETTLSAFSKTDPGRSPISPASWPFSDQLGIPRFLQPGPKVGMEGREDD